MELKKTWGRDQRNAIYVFGAIGEPCLIREMVDGRIFT